MRLPSPDGLDKEEVWESYIVAQTAQASLGLIPEHTIAFGVEVHGPIVVLWFYLTEIDESDESDIGDIVGELETLVGDNVRVGLSCEIKGTDQITANGRVKGVFLSRGTDWPRSDDPHRR